MTDGPIQDSEFEDETEFLSVPVPDSPFSDDSHVSARDVGAGDLSRGSSVPSSSTGSASGELGLIQAARIQAQHRSRPAMQGIGLAAGIPGYTIVRELHRGGQGVVYLARQEGTGRQVAIKLMREGALARQSDRIRFEREIQVLAQLDNPNIVTIHDSGVAGGCAYYVMDFITGRKLDEFVEHNELSINDTLRLFIKVCNAINAAHLRGVIHRDIKPGNIRVAPDGEPHVLDFGLAKLESVEGDASDDLTQMTATGQFIGSLPWASPEQAQGDGTKIDVRTDVYSLGVILYQLICKQFPYQINGSMPEVAARIINETPSKLSTHNRGVGAELDTITLKALAKSRAHRYQTPGDLARDVERMLAGEPIEAKRDNWWYMLSKMIKRHCVLIAGIVAFASVLLVLLGWIVLGPVIGGAGSGRDQESLEAALAKNRALQERIEKLETLLIERGDAMPEGP